MSASSCPILTPRRLLPRFPRRPVTASPLSPVEVDSTPPDFGAVRCVARDGHSDPVQNNDSARVAVAPLAVWPGRARSTQGGHVPATLPYLHASTSCRSPSAGVRALQGAYRL